MAQARTAQPGAVLTGDSEFGDLVRCTAGSLGVPQREAPAPPGPIPSKNNCHLGVVEAAKTNLRPRFAVERERIRIPAQASCWA